MVYVLLGGLACFGALLGAFAPTEWLGAPLMALPALGRGLRALSLSGGAGNAAAWVLYLLLSLLPLLGLLPAGRKRGWADAFFLAASLYSFRFWYVAVNPTLLTAATGHPQIADAACAMAAALLVLLLLGGILMRIAHERESQALLRGVAVLLMILAGVEALSLGLLHASALREAAKRGELGWQIPLCLCDLARGACLIFTLLSARRLAQGLSGGWFSEGNEQLARALGQSSRTLLLVSLLSAAASGALSLLALGRVQSSGFTVSVPLTELLAALGCMVLSRFVADGVRLRRENDSFI